MTKKEMINKMMDGAKVYEPTRRERILNNGMKRKLDSVKHCYEYASSGAVTYGYAISFLTGVMVNPIW